MPQAKAENFRGIARAHNVFLLLCFPIPPTNLAHPLRRRVPDCTHLSVRSSILPYAVQFLMLSWDEAEKL